MDRLVLASRLLLAPMVVAVGASSPLLAQNCADMFNPNQVLTFYITVDQSDWNSIKGSCPGGYCGPRPHVYYPATIRCGSGPVQPVGLRRKNGLAEPANGDQEKIPLKVDINEFSPGQLFYGKGKLSLENGQGGALLSEGLSWRIFQQAGVIAPRSAWVNVYVNGVLRGLYINVEQIDKLFFSDRGIDDGGFLFKVEDQRTRENESSPFAFNWYPFDHPHTPAEVPQPSDWRTQAVARVNIPHLLSLAAVENFLANPDAAVQKGTNYWYYDWAVFPSGQRPRLYLPWDYDTAMRPRDTGHPILGLRNGHLREGILLDPTFQPQYLGIYNSLISGPLAIGQTLALVNALEPVLTPHWNADPYQSGGSAAGAFQDGRTFIQARTASVQSQLGACPDAVCGPGESSCSCPPDCGLPPAAEGVCANALDDDCDAAADCGDTDCVADAACAVGPIPNRVVINEVLAATSEGQDVEFIELFNAGPAPQDLTGWYVIDDDNLHDKCFLEGTLAPGEYLVVPGFRALFMTEFPEASDVSPNQFDSATSGEGFSLSNSEDSVRLFRPSPQGDVFVHGFSYGPQGNDLAFGHFPDNGDAPEYLAFPTPSSTNTLSRPHSPICINELFTTSQLGGVDDWVELYNRGTSSVNIGGWKLSDTSGDPSKYTFPPGTLIGPGGRLVVNETQLGFSFTSTGSEVVLLTHSDGATGMDYFDYGLQFPDVSQGRVPDGGRSWHFMASPSPSQPNQCSAPPLAPVTNMAFSSATTLIWDAAGGAVAYDIVRGSLGALQSTAGGFTASVLGCQINNASAPEWAVLDFPSPGEGLFYIVRAVNGSCGVGTYDAGSSSQAGSRDAEIDASTASCP